MNGCDCVKYFLAFDTKEKEDSKDYVVIPNNLLGNIDVNNNLRALCNVTCGFENEQELKNTIIKMLPNFEKYRYSRLVVLWSREVNGERQIFSDRVLYGDALKLFDIDYLTNVLTRRVQEKSFLTRLYNYYLSHDYLRRELESLNYAVKSKDVEVISCSVTTFLKKLLFGKTGLEYAKLYKLITNLLYDEMCISYNNECTSLSETEQFELEWLHRRARLRQQNGGYY